MTKATPLPSAEKVVKGMPPGEISDKMEYYEALYYNWLGVSVDDYGTIGAGRWFTWIRKLQMRVAATPIRIFRCEISELGLKVAKAMNDLKAQEAQAQTYQEYVRMVAENRDLRAFLEEHFKDYVKEAEARNISIPLLVKEMLLHFGKK
jgi:hypothetical protein